MKTRGFISQSAHIDGAKIHYTIGGSGPTVILLHGFAETSKMWTPILPTLAEKFSVVAVDLPGIGESSIPSGGIDMKRAAIQIHDLVRSMGIERARIVGHDIGLMVAYAYAALFPSETEKLVLMDAFLPVIDDTAKVGPQVVHRASLKAALKRKRKAMTGRILEVVAHSTHPLKRPPL